MSDIALENINTVCWNKTDTQEHVFDCHDEIKTLRTQLTAANATIDALKAKLTRLVATIEAHEIESLSCDRDGEKYCECLKNAAKAAKDTPDADLDAQAGE